MILSDIDKETEISFLMIPDACSVTASQHVGELRLVAGASDQFVRHRLVALPPRTVVAPQHHILVGWGDLQVHCILGDIFLNKMEKEIYSV